MNHPTVTPGEEANDAEDHSVNHSGAHVTAIPENA